MRFIYNSRRPRPSSSVSVSVSSQPHCDPPPSDFAVFEPLAPQRRLRSSCRSPLFLRPPRVLASCSGGSLPTEEGPRSLSRSRSLHPLSVVRTRPSRQPNNVTIYWLPSNGAITQCGRKAHAIKAGRTSQVQQRLLAQPLSLPGGSVILQLVRSLPGWTPRLRLVPLAAVFLKLAVLNVVPPSTTTALARTSRSGTIKSTPIGVTVSVREDSSGLSGPHAHHADGHPAPTLIKSLYLYSYLWTLPHLSLFTIVYDSTVPLYAR